MSDTIYLSRFFVEFGPFAKKDILDLQKRGLLHETDYLLADGSTVWVHKDEWLSGTTGPAPAKPPVAKKAPAKPAAKAPAAKKAKSAA